MNPKIQDVWQNITNLKTINYRLREFIRKRPLVLPVICGMGFVFGLVMYIGQVNTIATLGHSVKELEAELRNLEQIQFDYKVAEADLRSMQRLELGIEAMEMEKITEKKYVRTGAASSFARR